MMYQGQELYVMNVEALSIIPTLYSSLQNQAIKLLNLSKHCMIYNQQACLQFYFMYIVKSNQNTDNNLWFRGN